MTEYDAPHRIEHAPCARGCTVARRHLAACPDQDACRGCQPRTAENGNLCYSCHRRFVNLLGVAGGQVMLLEATAGDRGEYELTSLTTARIRTMWRTDTTQDFRTLYARAVNASHTATEPIRLACLDSAQEIVDRLSLWVVHMVNDHRLVDPEADPLALGSFLLRHIVNLEHRAAIGDEVEEFMTVMSQAHSLAPWREQVARLHGIPCPECHATTLVMFGGDSDVTCLRCKAAMSSARYGLWTRMLADEHRKAGA